MANLHSFTFKNIAQNKWQNVNNHFDHKIGKDNNLITKEQWEEISDAAEHHLNQCGEAPDSLYYGKTNRWPQTRYSLYDNHDRGLFPGLDFVITLGQELGRLTVYDSDKMSYAPITYDQGLQIARNFFNETGTRISSGIVCDHINNSDKIVDIWS